MVGWGYAHYRAAAEQRLHQIRGLESLRAQLELELSGACDPVVRERIAAMLADVKRRLEAVAHAA